MSMQIDVEIQVKNALKRIDAKTVDDLITAALVSGGLLIANKAKELAPWETGSLRRSIHVGGHVDMTKDYDPAGDLQRHGAEYSDLGARAPKTVVVGTNLEYAPYQEYGTSRGVPAHPYMKPAMDIERDNVIKEAGEAFFDLVAAEVAKG